jgi:hypothetical protein
LPPPVRSALCSTMTTNARPQTAAHRSASELRTGQWILTYAPRGQRPRWHRVTVSSNKSAGMNVELLSRARNAKPFTRHFAAGEEVTVATAFPDADPDLVGLALSALQLGWPAIAFEAWHLPGGLTVRWTEGPVCNAVDGVLTSVLGGCYKTYLWRETGLRLRADWLLRTFPESDPRKLRRLAALAEPCWDNVKLPTDPTAHELRMAQCLCGIAGNGSFQTLKVTYARLGYDAIAAIAAIAA